MKAKCCAQMYLQVTVDESIDLWHALMIDSSQNHYEQNHHKSWKSPTQKEKQQISPLCMFIIHHQYIPEIHRLRKETEHKMSMLWSNDPGHKLTWFRHNYRSGKGQDLLTNNSFELIYFSQFIHLYFHIPKTFRMSQKSENTGKNH